MVPVGKYIFNSPQLAEKSVEGAAESEGGETEGYSVVAGEHELEL